MSRINKQIVYVDLESLIDTRMAILLGMNESLAMEILANKKYHERETEFLAGFDFDVFMKKCEEYDTDVLRSSYMSNLIYLLKDFSLNLEAESIKNNVPMRYEIHVNTWPYNLDQEEIDDLKSCIESHLELPTTVEMVHLPMDMLTPQRCKGTYTMMFMYRYYKWIDYHIKELRHCLMPGIELYAPAVSFVKEMDAEASKIITKEGIHPLKFLTLSISPMITLKLIDAKFFSIFGNLK